MVKRLMEIGVIITLFLTGFGNTVNAYEEQIVEIKDTNDVSITVEGGDVFFEVPTIKDFEIINIQEAFENDERYFYTNFEGPFTITDYTGNLNNRGWAIWAKLSDANNGEDGDKGINELFDNLLYFQSPKQIEYKSENAYWYEEDELYKNTTLVERLRLSTDFSPLFSFVPKRNGEWEIGSDEDRIEFFLDGTIPAGKYEIEIDWVMVESRDHLPS